MILHSRIEDALYFIGVAWTIAALFIVLQTGISARLRAAAERWVRWRFAATIVYFALLTVVLTIMEFPLTFYEGFMVPHQFELTRQGFPAWLGDFGKDLGVNIIIGSFVAALVVLGIRLFR